MSQALYINGIDQSSYVVACSPIPLVVRARNYQPAFNGFTFSVSKNIPDEPTKGQSVYLEVDGNLHYLGFITDKKFNNSWHTWDLEVTHWLMKMKQYRVRYQDLHSDLVAGMISDTATWETFTVDDSTDVIQKTAHGLSTGDKIQFKSSGTLPAPLEANHVYYVYVVDADSFKVFEDFAMYMEDTAWAGGDGSHGYVDITDTGSGTHEYTADLDQSKYNDWSFYRDINFNVHDEQPSNRFYTQLKEGDFSYPFMYIPSASPDDEWSVIMFDCDDGDTLPALQSTGLPLEKNRAYLAGIGLGALGEYFWLFNNRSDFDSNATLYTEDMGSGRFYYSVLRRKREVNDDRYPTAIIQLKHFIVTVFQKIGVVLDTSSIDDLIFYKYQPLTTAYKWTEIYFMESLLYNINQTLPCNWADVDGKSQITLVEFIQDIFQRLGLVIKFVGFQEDIYPLFKIYSQFRNSLTGSIEPSNEPQYAIPDDGQIDYSETEIVDDNSGWYNNHPLVGSLTIQENLSFIFSNKKKGEENWIFSSLQVFNRLIDGHKAQLEDLSVKTNLVFFLKDKIETNGPNNIQMIRDGGQLTGKEMLLNFNYPATMDSLAINGIYALYNHIRKEIECQAFYLSQNVWTVKEIYYDVSKERVKIIQEVNQLTSG